MKKSKYIRGAYSKKNGIVFYSNTIPLISCETFRDESGEIQSRIVLTALVQNYDVEENEKTVTFIKKEIVMFDTILIGIAMLLKNINAIFGAIYFSLFVSKDFFDFIKTIYQFKSKKGKQYSRCTFHAAEHMAINAYESLQRIPTLDEAKKYSRFSKGCGSNQVLFKVIRFTTLSVLIVLGGIMNPRSYLITVALIFTFMIIAYKKSWIIFLQVFFTNVPSDSELEVAIEGIRNFEAMEERFNGPNGISEIEKAFNSFIMEKIDDKKIS